MLDRIRVDPRVCEGRPTIRGLRITVDLVLDLLADGHTAAGIVRAYPELETEDVYQAARYGAWLARHQRLPEDPGRARDLADAPVGRDLLRVSGAPSPATSGAESDLDELDPSRPVDLVVLSVKDRTARCRVLGGEERVTLRCPRLWTAVPGEIVTIRPRKRWRYAGRPYLSGDIEATRLDAAALGLVRLGLEPQGTWDPGEEYWGEEGEPVDEWAQEVIALGPRPEFEMEQVLPGSDPDDPDTDPIIEAMELKDAGYPARARRKLMDLLAADLRCLDAHAHLGNLVFDHWPREAVRHYEVGVRIGELSLPPGVNLVLAWGRVDNRPFLRCLHGYGLSLWRLGRWDEAASVFRRMLWLNPTDNQGVRFELPAVDDGLPWSPTRGSDAEG